MDTPATVLQRVAAALRPLDIRASLQAEASDDQVQVADAALTADERTYLEFYGMDFTADFPRLRHIFGFTESRGQRLAVHVFRQPQAQRVMLLVHGYLDHVGLFSHLIRYGLERGYTVVAFDLPGHGLSSGDRVAIDDFSDYRCAIESVKAACTGLPGTWQVIAQSTGASIVLDHLLLHATAFDKVVMLAPLVRPRGWHWISLAQRVLNPFKESVVRKFAENSNDPDFLEWIRKDPLQSKVLSARWIGALRRWIASLPKTPIPICVPMLLIQGDADETVDWRYNVKRIEQFFAGSRIAILPGGRHHLANESQPLRQRSYELMDEFFL